MKEHGMLMFVQSGRLGGIRLKNGVADFKLRTLQILINKGGNYVKFC